MSRHIPDMLGARTPGCIAAGKCVLDLQNTLCAETVMARSAGVCCVGNVATCCEDRKFSQLIVE